MHPPPPPSLPYKRLYNVATLWSNFFALFRHTIFKLGKWPYFKALFSAVSIDIHLLLFIKSFLKRVEGFPISPLGYKPYSRFAFLEFSLLCSLRKQPTFGDVTTGFPAKWRLRNERRNSILMTRHYSDQGSASDWSCCVGNLIQPIRSTTQIWVMTGHQFGISALVSQTSFWRGNQ